MHTSDVCSSLYDYFTKQLNNIRDHGLWGGSGLLLFLRASPVEEKESRIQDLDGQLRPPKQSKSQCP